MSELLQADSAIFTLDDENTIDYEKTTILNTSHPFLDFSRKISEASSIKKPVDTQLGIAWGKDLSFAYRNSTALGNRLKKAPSSSLSSPLSRKNNSREPSHQTPPLPQPTIMPLSSLRQTEQPNSASLDRLVADVLSYIESCPDHSAYSDDLAMLQPRLESKKKPS